MSWSTPKTNWTEDDGVIYTDFNRIEANIVDLDTRTDTLETDTAAHAATSTIHLTALQSRTATSTRSSMELTTTDSGHSSGDVWIRTDL